MSEARNATTEGAVSQGEYVDLLGEQYYCIRAYDRMAPFFMSVISSADHWLFISSTGGLTAGRINAESALFPYYTDDKVTENSVNTGPVACLFVQRGERRERWEPFARRRPDDQAIERNLYKNVAGDKLIFEEVNHVLGLRYRYAWRTSDRFGLVRTVWLQNLGDEACHVRLLDGVRNVLPYGATTALQTTMSNLLNAYKRSELDAASGLGIFALSATLTDRAEPSESLKATVAWQVGLEGATYLLSTQQLAAFRSGAAVEQERDVKGQRGAYLLCTELELAGGAEQSWSLVADVNQDHSQVAALLNLLRGDTRALAAQVEADIARGTAELTALVASADGLQTSADELTTAHHFANVLFNIMRGGIFVDNYRVDKVDLIAFLRTRNRTVVEAEHAFVAALPAQLGIDELYARAAATGNDDLIRLCYEYLPLTFSRRHGDPSRPWNRFSINLRQPDGSRRLDYQGNWRDIFQNWEPLAWSFPSFMEGMIARFVNATTADGYNPYRVLRDGIEWEVPEPDNPWANIGYWSDHQLIYLQKLLEVSAQFHPGMLAELLDRRIFSHADVPYRIRPYAQILENSYDTIDFDWESEHAIEARVAANGMDGRLIVDGEGRVFHVSLADKLLLLMLVKLTNLVPEGGIWMNTQRPEWNDANNALVGKGLSVVTTAYLRRSLVFCQALLAEADAPLTLTSEVKGLLDAVASILAEHAAALPAGFDDTQRRAVMDALGTAGSDYRRQIYDAGFSGDVASTDRAEVLALLDLALAYVDQTLRANRRDDGLFHAYNILQLRPGAAGVGRLYEMLEGQVAILSAGLLSSDEAAALLQSLRASALYRADQHSYILYPDRELPGFLAKNNVPAALAEELPLVRRLVERNDRSLLVRDENGVYHFNGAFRNAQGVADALAQLRRDPELTALVDADTPRLLDLFEAIFHHASFTGRSGTFFAFEGLGSIYWHMVSKLLLAVQENFWQAHDGGADPAITAELAAAYYDIRAGIGFNKPPAVYGAFPTDPYSHTPKGQGAKQPGMTGQVKEEILTRFGELGVRVEEGAIVFEPALLRAQELFAEASTFDYVDVTGATQSLAMPAGALAFTLCQTPIVLVQGEQPAIEVAYADGRRERVAGNRLALETSRQIFARSATVKHVSVHSSTNQ
ncbi:MAG: hypothetical protein M9936_26325 [Caldilinea sp.]|nr:hypothetical protein [Caldilinea sp.]